MEQDMTFNAHLSVLSAIIIGLAVVKLLQGIVWMIHGRQRIKVYWVHLVWVASTIFWLFVHYWNIGNWRSTTNVSFYGLADVLWLPLFFYLVAGLLFPPSGEDRPVDLRDFYYENHAWIFGMYAVNALTGAGSLIAIVEQPLALDTFWTAYLGVLVLGALAVTRDKWVHMSAAILVLLGSPFAMLDMLN